MPIVNLALWSAGQVVSDYQFYAWKLSKQVVSMDICLYYLFQSLYWFPIPSKVMQDLVHVRNEGDPVWSSYCYASLTPSADIPCSIRK